jgi:hypothetical protein
LTTVRWSLELGSKPFINQSRAKDQAEDNAPLQRGLLSDPNNPDLDLYRFPHAWRL